MNEDEVLKIYKNTGFTEESIIKFDQKKGVLIVAGKIHGDKKVLLKATKKNNPAKINSYYKEEIVGKMMQECRDKVLGKKSESNFKIGQDDGYIWLTREYLDGISLGDSSSLSPSPLYHHDNIRDQFLSESNRIIPNIYKAVKEFSSIKDVLITYNKNHPELFKERFSRELEVYDLEEIEKLSGIEAASSLSFYNKFKKEYFSKSNMFACIGDLVPSNIVIKKDLSVSLVDFEWVCLDNYMMDYAYLWLFLWKYKEWQDALIAEVIKTDTDKKFFRMSIIRAIIGTGWISNLVRIKDGHKWLVYLENASLSFDELINS